VIISAKGVVSGTLWIVNALVPQEDLEAYLVSHVMINPNPSDLAGCRDYIRITCLQKVEQGLCFTRVSGARWRPCAFIVTVPRLRLRGKPAGREHEAIDCAHF